jgi:hypothetical protein
MHQNPAEAFRMHEPDSGTARTGSADPVDHRDAALALWLPSKMMG